MQLLMMKDALLMMKGVAWGRDCCFTSVKYYNVNTLNHFLDLNYLIQLTSEGELPAII